MHWLSEFFSGFTAELYQMAVHFGAWLVLKLTISWITFKIFLLTFSWDIAKQILINVDFSHFISSSFNALPPLTKDILLYLNIDKGLSILSQAFITRMILNKVGF